MWVQVRNDVSTTRTTKKHQPRHVDFPHHRRRIVFHENLGTFPLIKGYQRPLFTVYHTTDHVTGNRDCYCQNCQPQIQKSLFIYAARGDLEIQTKALEKGPIAHCTFPNGDRRRIFAPPAVFLAENSRSPGQIPRDARTHDTHTAT